MPSNKNLFVANPVRLDRLSRSRLDLSHKRWLNLNTGYVTPILAYGDVLPGDTFKINLNGVIRGANPDTAVMDYAVCEVYFFFVPHKMTLSREMMSPSLEDSQRSFKAFIGAQDSLLNMPLPSDIRLPQVCFGKIKYSGETAYDAPFELNSLADYLALPTLSTEFEVGDSTGIYNLKREISPFEPLAYYRIWNDYFRDPNTMNPVTFTIGDSGELIDSDQIGFIGDFFEDDLDGEEYGYMIGIGQAKSILPACRFHGYFGSALPWPQRNSESVTLPLGDTAPVIPLDLTTVNTATTPLRFKAVGSTANPASNLMGITKPQSGNMGSTLNSKSGASGTIADVAQLYPANLYADLSQATAASVNQLRFAVQAQKWYEALARGGNRIGELTRAMFDVTPHDMQDDRPEFLGYKRFELGSTQVENTSTDLGEVGGFSLNSIDGTFVTKSFDTWGTIFGVMVIRVEDSFHQGLAKRYSRRNRFDLYWPQFANLGEQPVYKKEIKFTGTSTDDDVFGYQEAWAEYRFWPNEVTGLARPGAFESYGSLAHWTYVNDFETVPTLKGYLDASKQVANVDRTLKVYSSDSGYQWFGNLYFDIEAIRPMPLYSIPGLVDHH